MAFGRRQTQNDPTAPARRAVILTHVALIAERMAGAFWPLWSVGLILAAALRFDAFAALDLEFAYLLAVALAVGALWGGAHALRRFRWPSRAEAEARLDATLPGRPLSAVADRQSVGASDPASRQMWAAHQARMAERLAAARPVRPDIRLARADRFALRYVSATAFVVAVLFGVSERNAGLAPLFGGGPAVAQGPFYEAWVQPPAHTGWPTLYLNETPQDRLVEVPEGSRLVIRLYGDLDAMRIAQSVGTLPGSEEDGSPPAAETELEMQASGDLRLTGPGGAAAEWHFALLPDAPPQATVTAPPAATADGALKAGVHLADDYGVVAARVEFRLDPARLDRRYGLRVAPEPRAPLIFDIALPVRGDRTDLEAEIAEMVAEHPWAGLPVTMRIVAIDGAGQEGASADMPVWLPARSFFDPVAAALVEMRRDLLWNTLNGRRVAQLLRAVTWQPDDLKVPPGAFLIVRTVINRLEAELAQGALRPAPRDEAAAALWQAALLIEEGGLATAAERLRRAQERLSQALENGATPDEIARLMDELREAMRQYMQALAEEAQRNGGQQQAENQPGQEGQQITPQDLQRMLDEIERLSRQGRTEEAQRLLEALRQMMENMRVTQGQPGQNGQGQQAMQDLQQTLREQQGLSDEAFRQLQEQFRQGQAGRSQQNQGRNGQEGAGQSHEGQGRGDTQRGAQAGQGGDLADRQRALRERLEGLRRQLPGQGTQSGRQALRSLDRAGRAMDRAADNLEGGRTNEALNDQAEAMDALREGIQQLGQALAEQADPNRGQQGQQAGAPDPAERDPLGRRAGTNGRIGSDERLLGGDDVTRRADELRDEIRRRAGERDRPEIERDYLKRLLDQF